MNVTRSRSEDLVLLTHQCLCGLTHRVAYKPGTPTIVEACTTGTVMAVGPDAWARVRVAGEGDLTITNAPGSGPYVAVAWLVPRPDPMGADAP